MPKCIYCRVDKEASFFNTEHVLQDAFGSFKNNLTLKNVCWHCNDKFGRELDLQLGRDTFEGLQRSTYGIKKVEDFKTMGKNSRITIKIAESLLKGLVVYLFFDKTQQKIVLKPLAQIGLKKSDGTYDFFNFEDLPEFEFVYNKYPYSESLILIPPCVDINAAIEALRAKGYNYNHKGDLTINLEKILCEINGIVDKKIQRAVAKIAFNFFAYFNNESILLNPAFDEIRNFVLYGDAQIQIKVDNESILADEKTAKNLRLGHIITLERDPHGHIIVQISLFNSFRYTIQLSKNNKFDDDINVGFGRFFDINNLKIHPIETTRLSIPSINLLIPEAKIWIP